MPEDLAGVLEVSFAVSSAYDDLGSDAESEADHEQDHIIHDGNGRCSELDLTDSSKEGGVGQSDHLLHHQTYQDRECYLPDMSV